ncbi:MAG: helix-turn-helix domain-containing protein [Saprospiraceae bacterium]|nr:helix-turn-helix domain-containing protein [Saprospiraceae bacterium]
MSQKINRFIIVPIVFVCLGCGTLYAIMQQQGAKNEQHNLSQRINLALRRTAHLLLQQAGDSTSTIAPIQQTDENAYRVNLHHAFNYDSLPAFLQSSLDVFEVKNSYDVAVVGCETGLLVLGYSQHDVSNKENLPCTGREQKQECLNFSVVFKDPSLMESFRTVSAARFVSQNVFGFVLLLVATALGFYFGKNHLKKTQIPEKSTNFEPIQPEPELPQPHVKAIGASLFDAKKQTWTTHGIEQPLTFQETQLLHLFCEHPNELLDRDTILKSVWGDDGVLITRSVDVFVSRLRKIIKSDTSLKIANVHGRGYRLDVLNQI